MADLKNLPAVFFATPSGNEPVREWLKNLDPEDRRTVGEDIATAEFGWPVGMPLTRELGRGIHEIRSHISNGRISRVLFASLNGEMVLLHSFIKKTQATPPRELDLAIKRMKEYLS